MTENVFYERGISDEVRDARPYRRYARADPAPAKEPFADTSPANRAHISKIVNQSDGWVMATARASDVAAA